MGKTHVEIGEETRNRLRRYKSVDGLTYDEAINELLDGAEWVDPKEVDKNEI
jgi:hypothetical protein